MNLREYERAKFELAAILRTALPFAQAGPDGEEASFRELFARLAEDRFNLAVVGRFNRGKTSLMNAMLGTTRLPVGVVPLTSVITTMAYGSGEQVVIDYGRGRLPLRINIEELPAYVTQCGNPENARGVREARVQLPSEPLRLGFRLIDTPGLGSSVVANTRTTEAFLPEADALLLVTSFESPLSEEELRLLRAGPLTPGRAFLAVNKHDTVSAAERAEILAHIRDQLAGAEVLPTPQIFSVSARQALEATARSDAAGWEASGLPALLANLERFMLEERRTAFLDRMCARIESLLAATPQAAPELRRLRELRRSLFTASTGDAPAAMSAVGSAAALAPERPGWFAACAVCQRVEREVFDFLCGFQNAIASNPDARADLAARGGLCDFHTWVYQAMASPQGTCLAYPEVLERLAAGLRTAATLPEEGAPLSEAVERLRPREDACEVCRVQALAERAAVEELLAMIKTDDRFVPDVCMPHFQLVLRRLEDHHEAAHRLLLGQAGSLDRLAADMRRYALKVDGVRSALVSQEEDRAHMRGLMLLAGHPSVTGPGRRRR
ncbi:Dynamin family protein [Humidesulfovibrio mexicanus]|uniref:Dynamin family protein n=1 Tax=Humidesulfovibrio mexicanus TaxID=147047 RepID=A0A239CIW0_9BACT|nr:dynamin family protein [Humidesulfovibrio mexicanus]SNS19273.1 Dynamin family protein [Humidesulfovibrio mexicanus]